MRKIIFLDRDGVINQYPGDTKYVTSWSGFKFLPLVKHAILRLTEAGYNIFVVSNQAGVSGGLFKKEKLDLITRNMLSQIKSYGGNIKNVFYCIHTTEDNCSCRKPKTGLIDKSFRCLGAKPKAQDLKNIYFIGDSIRDVETGKNAKLKTILVLSGREHIKNKKKWAYQPDYIFKDLLEAVDFILS